MRILKIANKNVKKLEKAEKILQEVCEDLKREGISSNACSIRLDLIDLKNNLS